MYRLSRSTALKIAAVISFLANTYNLIGSLPMIVQGSNMFNQATPGPPYFILMLGFILSIIAVVAAYGTWKQMRWGIILTIVTSVIGGLSAAPGLVFRPTPGLFIGALVAVTLSIVIVVLCLWPDRKPAVAA
jgi:hypothetical protein